MKFNLRLLRFLLKVSLPLYILLMPAVAIYGYFNPWPPATSVISAMPEQMPVMVGFNYREENSLNKSSKYTSRSYIFVPSVFSDLTVTNIAQINNDKPVVTRQKNGFVFYVVWFVICLIGTWWFWFRRKDNNLRDIQMGPR